MIRGSIALAVVCLAGRGPLVADESAPRRRERIVGLPCEGCEAVFEGLPDRLISSARIAPMDEPGQSLRIEGTARDRGGRPMSGVIVYAYHANAAGLYPPDDAQESRAARRHGRLRGWAVTDGRGKYRFDTIRPAGYPNSDLPAHVHMHIIEVGRCTYYIDDIMFEDDPRLTKKQRQSLALGRGGAGIVAPIRDPAGRWFVTRDIVLGERIPGYPEGAEQGDESERPRSP